MAKSVSYAVSSEIPISSRGPLGARVDIGRGWYGIWYGFCHVLYTLSYIKTEEYTINLCVKSVDKWLSGTISEYSQ